MDRQLLRTTSVMLRDTSSTNPRLLVCDSIFDVEIYLSKSNHFLDLVALAALDDEDLGYALEEKTNAATRKYLARDPERHLPGQSPRYIDSCRIFRPSRECGQQ